MRLDWIPFRQLTFKQLYYLWEDISIKPVKKFYSRRQEVKMPQVQPSILIGCAVQEKCD